MSTSRTTRWIVAGIAAVVVIAATVMALMPDRIAVDTERAIRGPLEVTLEHEGHTRVRERFVVSAPVAGRVRRIELEPGDEVRAGTTVVAVFEPASSTPLDLRTRREAEARVAAARAQLDQAHADVLAKRAQRDFARSESERYGTLGDRGVVPREQADLAAMAAASTEGSVAAAEAAVERARRELESAQAALLEPWSETGGDDRDTHALRLTSPVDGVVLRRLHENEAVVPAGEPLLEIADRRDLEVVADFLSSDATSIRAGMAVHLTQWGGEQPLTATVRRVEPSAFTKVSALGVEEQRVWVVIDLDAPGSANPALGDRYRVEAEVVAWHGDGVLQVPTAAMFRSGESWAVFVVEGGRAHLRTITVGHRNELHAEVVDGLSEGDVVIAHPPDNVADGTRIVERES